MHDDDVLFVTPFKRRARSVCETLQEAIEERDGPSGSSLINFRLLAQYQVPEWAHSVRVKRAGLAEWAVIATERRT